jgi:hypothetical protein
VSAADLGPSISTASTAALGVVSSGRHIGGSSLEVDRVADDGAVPAFRSRCFRARWATMWPPYPPAGRRPHGRRGDRGPAGGPGLLGGGPDRKDTHRL